MKITSKFVSLFLFILCFSNALQAFHENACLSNSIACCVDRVITHEQGVVLLVDNFWLGAQGMQATQDGIWVLENGEWLPLAEVIRCDNYYVWQCRKCHAWNPEGTDRCYRCGAPRD